MNSTLAIATSAGRPASHGHASSYVANGGYLVLPSPGLYRHDGPDALDLLQRITTNDLQSLQPGHAVRTVIADERGRIVDVPWVVKQDQDDLLLITDAHDTKMVERAILKYTIIEDACLTSLENQLTRVKFIGGAAEHAYREFAQSHQMSELSVGDWLSVDEMHLLVTEFGDVPSCDMVIPTADLERALGRTGDDSPWWSEREFHATRVALGVPWPGYELTNAVNPLDVGLRDLIGFDKGCYVGQEVIARLDTYDKVQRSLVKLRCKEESTTTDLEELARESDILNSEGRNVGWISSSETMPDTGKWVGLGIVRNDWAYDGSTLATRDGHLLEVVR